MDGFYPPPSYEESPSMGEVGVVNPGAQLSIISPPAYSEVFGTPDVLPNPQPMTESQTSNPSNQDAEQTQPNLQPMTESQTNNPSNEDAEQTQPNPQPMTDSQTNNPSNQNAGQTQPSSSGDIVSQFTSL